MQLLHNFYQVGGSLQGITTQGEDPNYHDCNTYALKTESGIILFDCGCGDTLEQIDRNMSYWDMDPKDVIACLITHPHLDHAGGAHRLVKRGIELYAHENTADMIAAGDETCCGYLYHKTFTPCTIKNRLSNNQRISIAGLSITVLHLPGHTMGCTAYCFTHENKQVIISGDIIGTLLDGDFGWSGSFDFDKKIYLESLRRFARLDFDLMFPGHGLSYFNQPKRRVEKVFNQALISWR